jgi:hypothetical protein
MVRWFNARMTSNQPWWLTWPVAEVAATILPCFSQSEEQEERDTRNSIVNWCKTGSYKSVMGRYSLNNPDGRAVIEAIQVLEHAGLLVRTFSSDRTYLGLTRLGMHALQTNTVRQHLGIGDAPPTT